MSVTYVCRGYSCDTDGIRTESKAEFDEHHDLHHPITCRCGALAAYAYNPGAPGAYTYCAKHAAGDWERNETLRERVYRITRTANEDAERLPDDHPLERTLRERADE